MNRPSGSADAAAMPAPRRPARHKTWLRALVAVALLAGVLWLADVGQVAGLLQTAQPGWLVVALACGVLSNLVSAWRWRALVQWLGHGVGLAWAVGIYFQAVTINALLPGAVVGGDVYRANRLVRRGMSWLAAGLSVLCDRLSGLWVLLALGAAAAAWAVAQPAAGGLPPPLRWMPAGGWLALTLALLALPLLLLALGRRALPPPVATADVGPAAAGDAPAAPPLRQRLALLAHRPHALAQYGWQLLGSVGVQLLSVGVLACGGAALGLALPYWAYALAAVPVFLMATLPISLGGWGTREAAAVLAFGSLGLAAPQAVALAVLYGLSALVQALAGALLIARGAPASG